MEFLLEKRPLRPFSLTLSILLAGVLSGPFREVFLGGTQPGARSASVGGENLGTFPGLASEAEPIALQRLERHLSERSDLPLCLCWRELDSPNGGLIVASYDPQACALRLWLDERNVVSYAPITLAGIRRTLARGRYRGSFASARADSLALAGHGQ